MRYTVWVFILFSLVLWGCATVKPIITPQEYQNTCRQGVACADRICDGFQETVTDYYDTMAACRQACKDKADTLSRGASGTCLAGIDTARGACMEFCQRKFYRCNCDKESAPAGGNAGELRRSRP